MTKKQFREREKVTPKMAKEFLDSRRQNQRKLSERHVAELADAMLYNRWVPNGESLKFDIEGFMIDGQHRCAGCIKAGKSFVTDIVYNLPLNAYYTIDQKSKNRSSADVLRMNGEVNSVSLASALAYNIAYLRGCIKRNGKNWIVSPDSQEIVTELSRHPTMRESVLAGRKCCDLLGPGALSFLHYRFKQKDEALAGSFFVKLGSGEDISPTNPVLHIRKMLIEDKIKNKAKLPMGEKIACIIKGWNLLRDGKRSSSRKSIQWKSGGKYPEPFPKIK